MNSTNELATVKQDVETLLDDLFDIMGCLETLENSIYFSSERKDKDLSKSFSRCADSIRKMVNDCVYETAEIKYKLEKL